MTQAGRCSDRGVTTGAWTAHLAICRGTPL